MRWPGLFSVSKRVGCCHRLDTPGPRAAPAGPRAPSKLPPRDRAPPSVAGPLPAKQEAGRDALPVSLDR